MSTQLNPGADVIAERLARFRVPNTLREAYFQLGLKLVGESRARPASEAFESALREPGNEPPLADLHIALAEAAAAAQAMEPAFRSFVIAALHEPASLTALLARAQSCLTEAIASAQAPYLQKEWLPQMLERVHMPAERAQVWLFAGDVSVASGDLETALSNFRLASEEDEALGREAARTRVPQLTLASRLVPGDAERYLVIARIQQALGDLEAALHNADMASISSFGVPSQFPERAAHRLKGELFELRGEHSEAAASLVVAGQCELWAGDARQAVVSLEKALELDATQVDGMWRLADALLIESYSEQHREGRRELLSRASELWNRAYALERPTKDNAWVYATKASLVARVADLDPDEFRPDALWEAAALTERTLLLGGTGDVRRVTDLSVFHRRLGNLRTALDASRRGYAANRKSAPVLSELAVVLTNLVQIDEAVASVDELEKIQRDAWSAFVASRLHFYRGNTTAALERLDEALRAEPKDLTYRTSKALVLRGLGRIQEVREIAESVLSEARDEDFANLGYYAWAALHSGNFGRAEELYLAQTRRYPLPPDNASPRRSLAFCRLAQGHPEEARQMFEDALKQPIDPEDRLLLEIEIDALRLLSGEWANPERDLGVLKDFEKLLQDVPREVGALAPRAELERILNSAPPDAQPVRTVAVLSAMARIEMSEGDPGAAALTYRELAGRLELFLEAPLGLLAAIEALREKADIHLMDSRPAEAHRIYGEALEHASLLTPPGLSHSTSVASLFDPKHAKVAVDAFRVLKARIAYASFVEGDLAGAKASLLEALRDAGSGDGDFAKATGTKWSELVATGEHYWALDDWLETLGPEVSSVREGLAGYFNRAYELSSGVGHSPWVTPIAVELERSLVPEGNYEEWPLFKTYLPEMRERIKRETGVMPPGTRVRANDTGLAPRTYIILFDEVPIVSGNVKAGARFCPISPPELGGPGLEEGTHPATGHAGCWVPPERWNEVLGRALPLWEPLLYITYHLEAFLARDLRWVFGVQETKELVDEWATQAPELVSARLPSTQARLRLRGVLRELIRERVPITAFREILSALQLSEPASLDQDIRAVRLALKPQLPGNRPGEALVALPTGIEQELTSAMHTHDGQGFLALEPERVQQVLTEMRDLMRDNGTRSVLVTRNAALRPLLRRVVELEFPDLLTIAAEELAERSALA